MRPLSLECYNIFTNEYYLLIKLVWMDAREYNQVFSCHIITISMLKPKTRAELEL